MVNISHFDLCIKPKLYISNVYAFIPCFKTVYSLPLLKQSNSMLLPYFWKLKTLAHKLPSHCFVFSPVSFKNKHVIVVVDLGFMILLTSQINSVAFYSEHEKSDKFCWEALILAWGSFMCHKSTKQDPRHYFPLRSEKIRHPGLVWTSEPWIQWRVW